MHPLWCLRHSHLGTYSSHIGIHGRFYRYLSQSFSRGPALYAKGAEKFSPEEQEENWRHFSPLASVIFVEVTVYLHSDSSFTGCPTQYFVYPSCIPSNSATTSRSPRNFHLNSSYLIFPNSSFSFHNFFFFILAAWTKGTEGTPFPL